MRWLLLALFWPGIATAAWDKYELIIWQDQTAERLAVLKATGFTAAKLNGNGGIDPAALAKHRASGLGYYLENIATDFYAPYHRYTPGKAVTWLWDLQKTRLMQNPTRQDVFVREPGLEDPAWRARVASRLTTFVAPQAANRPLYYALGDETGIGDLAAAWDADVSPASLTAFRLWLATQYPSLSALNQQWGTAYTEWSDIQPELTDAALRRTDDNYSAWSDFKEFMDVSFASAVQMGTDAVHRADPAALSAIEGAQVPGWGGYDYGRLASTVDVMEIYDSGQALAIARSLNPALIALRTSFGAGPEERHAAWAAFLAGVRGTIVWDEDNTIVQPDGTSSARARAMAAQTAEFQALASRLWAAKPFDAGVAVLVSQESFRLRWLLDRRVEATPWWERDAEREGGPNAWRTVRDQLAARLAAFGITPRYLTSLEHGLPPGIHTLLLPHVLALSDAETDAIERARPAIWANEAWGAYDGRGRRRAKPLDSDITVTNRHAFRQALEAVPVRVLASGEVAATDLVLRVFNCADGTMVSVQTAQPGAAPRPVTLGLPLPRAIHDLRAGAALGRTDRLTIMLDPIDPMILLLQP